MRCFNTLKKGPIKGILWDVKGLNETIRAHKVIAHKVIGLNNADLKNYLYN